MSLDRLHYPGKRPWGNGEAEREELENISLPVHYEGQKLVAVKLHGHMVKSILTVHRATPHWSGYAGSYGRDPFHLEFWNYKEGVQSGKIYDKTIWTIFFGDDEEA